MTKKNNIAVLHVVSSLQVGGAERFVVDLCQIQQSHYQDIAIMSFGHSTDVLQEICQQQKIKVHNVIGGRISKWIKIINILSKYDVIHCHSPYPLKLMSVLLPFYQGKKIIYTRHGANPLNNKSWKNLHKYLEKYVDNITFVSHEGADVFTKNHGWPDHTKHVIDNGVNLKNINITREPSNKLRIGSVGRMITLKNQVCLIKAISLLTLNQQKNIEVNFYGDGPCLEELKKLSDDLLANSQVNFHGMVSNRNTIYNAFDVLVVTSETEGLSLAIIEAMAYQCSIIATDVGGNPKLIAHNANGWLFAYDDIQQLSVYILQLQTNKELLGEFGRAGLEKIKQQFSLDSSAEQYHYLYGQ